MISIFLLAVVYFTPGLLACSLPPFTRFYTVTERTILAPIVVHARVINTTASTSGPRRFIFKACVNVEKVIKGRQNRVPRAFCFGDFGPEELCLDTVRAGYGYVFFINDDFTARYEAGGFPKSSVLASDRMIQEAEKGYCDPYGVEDETKCELPSIEFSTFKRVAIGLEGEDLLLPCSFSGTPPLISKWTKKAQLVPGFSGSLILNKVSRKDAGVYVCTVYNPAGKTRERSYVRIRQIPCGGFITLNNASNQVTIQSPNFPNPFPKDKMCTWRICPPPGKRLEVRFDTFDLRRLDRLDIVNECDRRLQPWQVNCGSVSPGVFVSRCQSPACLRLGLSAYERPNQIASGFNATITATDKISTEYDVAKLWCNYNLVAKARPVQIIVGEVIMSVIQNYKDGVPKPGENITLSHDIPVVNMFGCQSDIIYNRVYYMVVNNRRHVVFSIPTNAPEVPEDFEEKLAQYKKTKPNCSK